MELSIISLKRREVGILETAPPWSIKAGQQIGLLLQGLIDTQVQLLLKPHFISKLGRN